MLVSCICVCHNKPDLTQEAIQSILHQDYPHWEAIVVDSGVLFDAGYYDACAWRRDPRVRLIRSQETEEIRRTKAMAPWCYNECLRKGLISGELVMYLCDDDILYPNAFATFVGYCRQNPDALAMYAAQDIAVIYPNGWRAIVGERRATRPGGRFCNGKPMDCHIDYLQFCHKASILGRFPDPEYWPESKEFETHADGIFMERIGARTTIHPIDVKVSQNRRTIQSLNAPLGSFNVLSCVANGIPFLPSQADEESPESRPVCATADLQQDVPRVTVSIAFRDRGACLADTLASVAAQTYPNLEVLIIDHRSADAEPPKVVEAMRRRYPHFRFLRDRAALQGRGLWEAQGVYFVAMDADTPACPEMVERLVGEMRRNPKRRALTCYLAAFREGGSPPLSEGSAHLASTKNLYGGGMFHTDTFREVGGYGSDLEMRGQEWLGFLNLVNNGHLVDIVPEHLFYYRPGHDGSPRPRHQEREPERTLRPFFRMDKQLANERVSLWKAFAVMQRRFEQLAHENGVLREQNQALAIRCAALRYQVADRLTMFCTRVPFAKRGIEWLLRSLRTQNQVSECGSARTEDFDLGDGHG